jgi:NTP pyrophosphatase (non-canonical NTP hydrolase)
MQACKALEVSIDDVVAGNVEKLKKRYPGGEFDVHYSENRAANDR